MDQPDFFMGQRKVDQYTFTDHGGKVNLSCTILEQWEEILTRSIRCGTNYKHKFTRRLGFSAVDREDLQTTIVGSLGIKGIVEFKSQLEGSTGRELRLEEICEVEEEFNFKAPECGRFTVQLFQLSRVYRFVFRDERFLHKHRWSKSVKEWINRIHDASKQSENDPDCGCHVEADTGIDGLVYLSLGRISMLVPLKKVSNGLILPDLIDGIFPNLEQLWATTITVTRQHVRPYLLFLTDEKALKLRGRFTSSMEDSYLDIDRLQLADGSKSWLSSQSDVTDPLTGLANPQSFKRRLETEVMRSAKDRRQICLILLNIDRFKDLNDEHGYAFGDELLRRIGNILTTGARAVDLAARLGGDDFGLILPEVSLRVALRIAEGLRQEIAAELMTVSIGVAEFPLCAGSSYELLAVTDAAMFSAKQLGGDHVSAALAKVETDFSIVTDT